MGKAFTLSSGDPSDATAITTGHPKRKNPAGGVAQVSAILVLVPSQDTWWSVVSGRAAGFKSMCQIKLADGVK